MAFLETIFCDICKQEKQVTVGSGDVPSRICHQCQASKEKQDEVVHFARLDSMTVEERLREIEKWMYEHKNKKHYSPPAMY